MKRTEIEELIDHIFEILEGLDARISELKGIDSYEPDPLELALDESGYKNLEAEAFVEGYMRAEEDLA